MSEFKEFPKKMSHPEYQAAVFEQLPCHCVDKHKCNCRTGLFARDTICKSPERFAEVTVHTIDQQRQYEARGYRSNSSADRAAYEQALLESAPVAGYRNNEYPKWKYHPLEIPVTVADKAAEDALGDGWYDSPIEATEDDIEQDDDESDQEVEQVQEVVKPKTPAKKVAKKKPKASAKGKPGRPAKVAHA